MGTRNENVKLVISAKDKASPTLGGIQNKVLAIGAAYMGWQAVTGVIGSIIEKGVESERVWTDVAAALDRHGHSVDDNITKIQAFAGEMQTLSGESDETVGKMVQSFVDYGQTVDEAMETTRVAMDLAAGGGMNLMSATDLLSKAAVGYTSTLSRYGIIIDENIPKSEKFAAAMAQINERFGGAAASRMDTTEVKLKLMSERFGDLQEQIFELFSPALFTAVNTAVAGLDSLMGAIDFLTPKTRTLTDEQLKLENAILGVGEAAEGSAADLISFAAVSEGVKEFESIMRDFNQGVSTIDASRLEGITANLREMYTIAPDATNALIGGLEAASPAFKGVRDQATMTLEEIEAMMNDKALAKIDWASMIPPPIDEEFLDEFEESAIKVGEIWWKHQSDGEDAYREHKNRMTEIDNLHWEAQLAGLDEFEQERQNIQRWYEDEFEMIRQTHFVNEAEREQAWNDLYVVYAEQRMEIDRAENQQRVDEWLNSTAEMRAIVDGFVTDWTSAALDGGATWDTVLKNLRKRIIAAFAGQTLSALWKFIAGQVVGTKETVSQTIALGAQASASTAVAAASTTAAAVQVAEAAIVKGLTAQYIALAAAKAAATLGISAGPSIAGAAAVKASLVPMLLTGFDDPLNDEMGKRHGWDYMDNFMAGATSRASSPRYGSEMVSAIGQGMGSAATPISGTSSSKPQTVIVVQVQSGADVDYVRNALLPALNEEELLGSPESTTTIELETGEVMRSGILS